MATIRTYRVLRIDTSEFLENRANKPSEIARTHNTGSIFCLPPFLKYSLKPIAEMMIAPNCQKNKLFHGAPDDRIGILRIFGKNSTPMPLHWVA